MAIKPFRASVIKKASKSDVFKNLRDKYALAEEAGDRGLSGLQMDKKLKEMGYNPRRREAVMSHITGDRKIDPKDYKLTVKQLKNKYNLSAEEIKIIEKRKTARKRMNIILGKQSSGEVEKYIGDGIFSRSEKVKRKVYGIKKGVLSEKDLGVEGVSNIVGHFALNNKNAAVNKPARFVNSGGASVTNQLSNSGKNLGGTAIPLSKT